MLVLFVPSPFATARGDGAKRPTNQCSRVGTDKAEWCAPPKGDVGHAPLPGSKQHEGENKLVMNLLNITTSFNYTLTCLHEEPSLRHESPKPIWMHIMTVLHCL